MNPSQVIVEHCVPIPPRWESRRDPNLCVFCSKRPKVEPYKTCAECRQWAREQQELQRAKGLCLTSFCPNPPAPERTLCREHLTRLLEYSQARRKDRIARGVCIDCGNNPQWFGLRCVVCRSHYVKDGSLPDGARRALKAYRAEQAIARRRAEAYAATRLLTGRAIQVFNLRQGLVDGFDWSLEEIGQELGVTRERVRQIEARGYEDLATSGLNLSLLREGQPRKRRPVAARVSAYESAKRRAHGLVQQALRSGQLARQPCRVCGDSDSIAHHHKGYDFPLEVEWLCRHHHMVAHGRNKTGHPVGDQRLKPTQPAAWLAAFKPASPRIVAVLDRMKAFRPRLKQKNVIQDSGFTYCQLMQALRGFANDEAVINFLEIYMTQLENEQKAKAA